MTPRTRLLVQRLRGLMYRFPGESGAFYGRQLGVSRARVCQLRKGMEARMADINDPLVRRAKAQAIQDKPMAFAYTDDQLRAALRDRRWIVQKRKGEDGACYFAVLDERLRFVAAAPTPQAAAKKALQGT